MAHDLRRTLYHHIQRLSLAEHDEVADRRSDHAGHQRHRRRPGLHQLRAARHARQRDDAGRHDRGHVLSQLALHAHRAVRRRRCSSWWCITTRGASRRRRARFAKQEGKLLSIVEEVLTSIHVVQAFAREDYEQQRFDSESLANVEAGLQARSIKAKLSPLVEVIVAIGTCLVLWYGARLALAGQLSAGVLIVFLLYLGKMYKPMRDLSKMTDTVSKAMVGYERIQEVLEIESRVRDVPGARPAPRFKGRHRIRPRELQLRRRTDKPVLKDVSFTIEAGTGRGDCRSVGHREDDAREPDSALLRSGVRIRSHRRHGRPPLPAEVPARSDQFRPAGHAALPRHDLGEHRLRQAGRLTRCRSGAPPNWPMRTNSSRRCPTATTRWSASAASRCRAVNASALPLPGRSFAIRRS